MDIRHADTVTSKLIGLLGTKQFPDYDGLFLPGVHCIHTFFMQYPIDVLFLDKDGVVLKIAGKVVPYRIVWGCDNGVAVLEMRAGAVEEKNIKVGDVIHLKEKRNG